jgi:uncharacterized membrane protein YvlD (DUF360 family)
LHPSQRLKKLALATLAAGVAMWLLAGLWHKLILAGFYTTETHATHEGTGIIFVAYMVLAILMATIYPLGYTQGRPVLEGLRFGMLIGLLWVFPHELAMAGAHGTSLAYVFKNAAWHVVEQGAGGIVIALVYGRLQPIAED